MLFPLLRPPLGKASRSWKAPPPNAGGSSASSTTRLRLLACTCALLALTLAPAFARVGGGHAWGGGGGYHGGGYHGGGSTMPIVDLFQLIFFHPLIALLIVLVVVAFAALNRNQTPSSNNFDDSFPIQQETEEESGAEQVWKQVDPSTLHAMRAVDPNFSPTLLNDFTQLLYVRFHTARGESNETAATLLAPWFAPSVLADASADARARGIVKVTDVLVGSSHVTSIRGMEQEEIRLDVVFEGNFQEHTAQGPHPPLYITERWTFSRKRGVLSRGPGEITALGCPSCGSPAELRQDGTCPYCDQVVNRGDFAWVVVDTKILLSMPRPPLDLVGGDLFRQGYETGTDFPTVFSPDFEDARAAFLAQNPGFVWNDFEHKVRYTFLVLQAAWSVRNWEKARPYETDALFNMHRYWINMYERQHLTNRLEGITIGQIVAAKFDLDSYYDIITVRIYASMRDYTVNGAGRLVSGDPRTPREFSEYWTFIRRHDGKASPATTPNARADGTCPSCGAPLEVNMAGECKYCQSIITRGDFDWVLSSIEQDEAYRG